MAKKKAKPGEASTAKAAAGRGTAPATAPPTVLATQGTGYSQGLLREAAWSRMFGRTETKNPFTR